MSPDRAAALPRPDPGPLEAPFWAGCLTGQLRAQQCATCGRYRHPPRPRCASCRSAEVEWVALAGTGVIHSFTICHPPVLRAFAERVPYNAIVVRLDEGLFLVSNLVDHEERHLRCEQPVEVVFRAIDDELVLPQFRPRI